MNFLFKKEPFQTNREEYFNSISHAVAAIASFAGLMVLIILAAKSQNTWILLSTIIYGLSAFFLFTLSSFYHIVEKPHLKEKLRIADHSFIFIMIAGTYTPVLVLRTDNFLLLMIQWLMAFMGIALKIFFTGKFEWFSLLIYLVMGWLGILIIEDLYLALTSSEFWLMIIGGVAYTIGVVFYIFDHKIKFGHFIWHLFVLKGSIFHFLMIAFCLV